jgi:hypothetical protein
MHVRFDPPRCDRCGEASILQIITVAFEGVSPPDQFLCRAHAPLGMPRPGPDSEADVDVDADVDTGSDTPST